MPAMKHMLLIALGGAGGALSRYWLMNLVNQWHHVKFPFGTLAVNLIGSFAIGIMYVLITERVALHPDWRNVAMVGFLGAFTTFSTFSLEVITLLENGEVVMATGYMLSSLLLCVMAAWLAIYLTRLV
jgi:CrcB protein